VSFFVGVDVPVLNLVDRLAERSNILQLLAANGGGLGRLPVLVRRPCAPTALPVVNETQRGDVYGGRAESRGLLGDGPPPGPRDIHRAVALSRLTGTATAMLAAGVAAAFPGVAPARARAGGGDGQ